MTDTPTTPVHDDFDAVYASTVSNLRMTTNTDPYRTFKGKSTLSHVFLMAMQIGALPPLLDHVDEIKAWMFPEGAASVLYDARVNGPKQFVDKLFSYCDDNHEQKRALMVRLGKWADLLQAFNRLVVTRTHSDPRVFKVYAKESPESEFGWKAADLTGSGDFQTLKYWIDIKRASDPNMPADVMVAYFVEFFSQMSESITRIRRNGRWREL